MNTLKEYIVTQDTERDLLEIWKRELWESFRKGGRNPEKYKLITTFNADEQLQEQKGLRTSAEEILKTIYEKHVAAKPDGNWASWEKCVEDGTVGNYISVGTRGF